MNVSDLTITLKLRRETVQQEMKTLGDTVRGAAAAIGKASAITIPVVADTSKVAGQVAAAVRQASLQQIPLAGGAGGGGGAAQPYGIAGPRGRFSYTGGGAVQPYGMTGGGEPPPFNPNDLEEGRYSLAARMRNGGSPRAQGGGEDTAMGMHKLHRAMMLIHGVYGAAKGGAAVGGLAWMNLSAAGAAYGDELTDEGKNAEWTEGLENGKITRTQNMAAQRQTKRRALYDFGVNAVKGIPIVGGIAHELGEATYRGMSSVGNWALGGAAESDLGYGERTEAEADKLDKHSDLMHQQGLQRRQETLQMGREGRAAENTAKYAMGDARGRQEGDTALKLSELQNELDNDGKYHEKGDVTAPITMVAQQYARRKRAEIHAAQQVADRDHDERMQDLGGDRMGLDLYNAGDERGAKKQKFLEGLSKQERELRKTDAGAADKFAAVVKPEEIKKFEDQQRREDESAAKDSADKIADISASATESVMKASGHAYDEDRQHFSRLQDDKVKRLQRAATEEHDIVAKGLKQAEADAASAAAVLEKKAFDQNREKEEADRHENSAGRQTASWLRAGGAATAAGDMEFRDNHDRRLRQAQSSGNPAEVDDENSEFQAGLASRRHDQEQRHRDLQMKTLQMNASAAGDPAMGQTEALREELRRMQADDVTDQDKARTREYGQAKLRQIRMAAVGSATHTGGGYEFALDLAANAGAGSSAQAQRLMDATAGELGGKSASGGQITDDLAKASEVMKDAAEKIDAAFNHKTVGVIDMP
jgi:hypothetical protein